MPYQSEFDPIDQIVIVYIDGGLTVETSLITLPPVTGSMVPSQSPILLDFRRLKESIASIVDWVMFVDRLRKIHGPKVALLSTAVGHATSCHLIAAWASRDDNNVQAFQNEGLARRWLTEAS